jgi:hypothetical protein
VKLRESRVQKILGISPSADEIRKLLTGIGLADADKDLTFVIPPFRPDLEREVDLIEEVARLIGFDNIPYDVPSFKAKPNDLPAEEILNRHIRYALSAWVCMNVFLSALRVKQMYRKSLVSRMQKIAAVLRRHFSTLSLRRSRSSSHIPYSAASEKCGR